MHIQAIVLMLTGFSILGSLVNYFSLRSLRLRAGKIGNASPPIPLAERRVLILKMAERFFIIPAVYNVIVGVIAALAMTRYDSISGALLRICAGFALFMTLMMIWGYWQLRVACKPDES